ncbi:macrophage mannose receptor 1-like [Puntigrus tetrazona]|uniref:macrophage mannose receptor 1-like n=1 Tax=Puntigrus tetrazona TaxID=1606681 RepID=UPI001C88E2B9|nr:macrophage mannose receptor 1-like [Puntigrus tetrazona]
MMMLNKIQLVVFLAGILSKASCDLQRFVLIQDPKTWTEAQSYCRRICVDLATVQSDEDRAKLKEAANAENFPSDAWIGFSRDVWHWSYQNMPVSNAKWDSSQPNMPDIYMACGNINSKGRWNDRTCTDADNFFCQIDNQNTLQDKFEFIDSVKLNWTDAQTYCKTHYTDLAAVTDDAENTFLASELSSRNLNNAWFGLYRIPWLWSDNSGVLWSSVKWKSTQPDNLNEIQCARANLEH